jgi:hypothetical protein
MKYLSGYVSRTHAGFLVGGYVHCGGYSGYGVLLHAYLGYWAVGLRVGQTSYE